MKASATCPCSLIAFAVRSMSMSKVTVLIRSLSPSATSVTFSKTSRSLCGSPQPPMMRGTSTACNTFSTVFAASFGVDGVGLRGSMLTKCRVIMSAPNLSTESLAHAAGSSRTSLTCIFTAFAKGIFESKTSKEITGG